MSFVFDVGFFAAAFVPTFLVSRIIFRVTRRWEGSLSRLVTTNIASGIVCILVFLGAGTYFAGDLGFPWLFGILNYAGAQAIWLAVDIYSDWINDRFGKRGDTA